ncbi:MAG: hypothetical protein LQ338_006472 [Usnochroma carphineum]|nr:MAG: hypothetical protein LQ338_006472 [Usnochroma carphineum]
MNNNIAESFRRFGISPATTALYAIKLSRYPSLNAATVEQHFSESIEGTPLPFEEAQIARFTDFSKAKKIYKLTDTAKSRSRGAGKRGKVSGDKDESTRMVDSDSGNEKAQRKELEMMVLGLMALRGAT